MCQERCSYIKKSTTPMSFPSRPQMFSPSPLCTRGCTTPRTRRSARSATRRISRRTGRNLEGHNGSPATSAKKVSAGPIGGDCVVTSRLKSQDVARAHHRQIPRSKGTLRSRVLTSRLLHCPASESTGSCSLSGLFSRTQQLSDKNQNGNRGRVAQLSTRPTARSIMHLL